MHRRGFTLVELSIVLVIIGLLIGGILVGQSLISSAKIKAQVQQIQQFDIATSTFKAKFAQIPGDCSSCNHASTLSTTEGDNDGKLEDSFSASPGIGYYPEPLSFFVDLYTMGIIKDRYANNVSYVVAVGKNSEIPEAAIGRGGLIVAGNTLGDVYYTFTPILANNTDVGYSFMMSSGNLSPEEAAALDSTIDDGLPGTGSVVATTQNVRWNATSIPFTLDSTNASCINTGAPNIYNTSLSATNLCRIVIKSAYIK